MLLTSELRLHFSSADNNKKKFDRYNRLTNLYTEIWSIEMKLESYYTEIALNFSTSKENRPELAKKIKSYSTYAKKQVAKYPSYRLNVVGFNIITLVNQILNEHEQLMSSCERAIEYFNSLEHDLASTASFRYILRMLPSHIMLGNHERAEELVHQALNLISESHPNYSRVLEFYLVLGFYSHQYDIALRASEMAHNSPAFKDLPDSVQEYWKIYDGFIYLFIQLGKIKVPEDAAPRKFKVSRFLNEVPTYSKDKRGANVTILILQVLILLQQKKYDKIIDKADALKVYTSRYLRKNETYRSNCFIKMLLLLPHYAFNKKGVLRRSAKLEKRLSEVSIAEITPSIEVEVVPYETLWEIVKELLQDS